MVGLVGRGLLLVLPSSSRFNLFFGSTALSPLLHRSSPTERWATVMLCGASNMVPGFSPCVLEATGYRWRLSSTRSFQAPSKSDGDGMAEKSKDEASEKATVKHKRVGWKRTPLYGFPDPESDKWWTEGAKERFRKTKWWKDLSNESFQQATSKRERVVGYNKGDSSHEGSPGTLRDFGTQRYSNDFGEYPRIGETEVREGKNSSEGQRSSLRDQSNSNSGEVTSACKQEGDGRHSEQIRKPPFKPKPKPNDYEMLVQSRLDSGNGSPADTSDDSTANLSNKSRNQWNSAEENRSNGVSRVDRRSPDKSLGDTNKHRDTISQITGRAKRFSGEDRRRLDSGASKRLSEADNDGLHYGYKLRTSGPELGEFRRIGPQPSGPGRSFPCRDEKRSSESISRGVAITSHQADGRVSSETDMSSGNGIESKVTDSENPPEEKVKYPPPRLEGEKRWQYAVRKKQLGLLLKKEVVGFPGHSRGSTKKSKEQFEDEENLGNEPQGEDWRRKKIAWLCKKIPDLKPRGIVSILNDQRKWINAEDTKYVTEHLLKINQYLRGHRVVKWQIQQPWYEFDFELSTKVAVKLAENNKLSRTRDIYDLIIKHGAVPNLSTYVGLINCYIADNENPSLAQAWSLYNQMTNLGGHEPPPTLRYNLFQGLIQKSLNYLEQADKVFETIKKAGLVVSTKMYTLLIHAHGTKGNQDRVDFLLQEMKEMGLPVGQDVYVAILKGCVKDADVAVAERAFSDLKMAGHKPVPSVYSSLIKIYGKAGLPDKAFQTFEEMKKAGSNPSVTIYEPMIEVAAQSGRRKQAEELLADALERQIPSLHGCYNSLMELYLEDGLLDELLKVFQEMKSQGYPPNQASFNVLLGGYVKHGMLEKAETVFEDMRRVGGVGISKKTYELMIQLYGKARKMGKLNDFFQELADKKVDVSEEANAYLAAAVSSKRLEALRNSKLRLTKEHREILAGVLLAGAGVQSHDRNRTYEIHFGIDPESKVRLPILNHLYKLFSPWSENPPKREQLSDPTHPRKEKLLLTFKTVSHGSFRFFAHQYRPKHQSAIPKLIHRWLTPRTLAYWYMYGGTKCPITGDIFLNVSLYKDKEIMLVVNALKSRSIDCEKRQTEYGLSICFSGKSAAWLWGLMEPHILPEVQDLLKPSGRGQRMPMAKDESVG